MPKGNHHPSQGFRKNDPKINRKGRPKLDPIIKELRQLKKTEMTLSFSHKLNYTLEKLKTIVKDPDMKAIEVVITMAVLKWIQSGNFSYIQPYIEYIFGKPKENIDLEGDITVKWL